MERITLLDIDKTVVNTTELGKRVCQSLASVTDRDSEEIVAINKEYKKGLVSTTDFNHNDFLRKVAERTNVNFEMLEKSMLKPDNFVLFSETLEVLEKLSAAGEKLGTFSEADSEWQTEKLRLSGIIKFFDPSLIFIERRKLSPESVNKIPYGARLVDDKKEVIKTLRQLRLDLRLVWINRKDEEKIEGVKTIKSLSELL